MTNEKLPDLGKIEVRVLDDRLILLNQVEVGVLRGDTEAGRQFQRLVLALPRMLTELRIQRACCVEAMDGTWDCTTSEGQEAFIDMQCAIEEVLTAAGALYDKDA